MIKDIIESVCSNINEYINAESEYSVYTEAVKQGLNTPCFFVGCSNYSDKLYRGNRYKAHARIEIRFYFNPESDTAKADTQSILEKLWDCTEVIDYDNGQLRGMEREWENKDDGLVFYVSYGFFYYRNEEIENMEVLKEKGVKVNG